MTPIVTSIIGDDNCQLIYYRKRVSYSYTQAEVAYSYTQAEVATGPRDDGKSSKRNKVDSKAETIYCCYVSPHAVWFNLGLEDNDKDV